MSDEPTKISMTGFEQSWQACSEMRWFHPATGVKGWEPRMLQQLYVNKETGAIHWLTVPDVYEQNLPRLDLLKIEPGTPTVDG